MQTGHPRFWDRLKITPKRAAVFAIALSMLGAAWLYFGSLSVFCRYPRTTMARLYESWEKENNGAYREFEELARGKGLKMYVTDGSGIGILDLGHFTYDPLYRPPPRKLIQVTSRFRAERVAFIECTDEAPRWRNTMELTDFQLCLLDQGGKVVRVPLEWYLGRVPIVVADECVLFGSGSSAYLYDIETERLRRVFVAQAGELNDEVVKIGLVEGKFLVLLVGEPDPESLVVLGAEEPHSEIARMEGVSNMMVVGEHIVVEKSSAILASKPLIGRYIAADKDGTCFLYDPIGGTTERVTAGNLVCSWGTDEFLFCILDEGNTWKGNGRVYRYNISTRSKELVWDPSSGDPGSPSGTAQEKGYAYTSLFLSPDGRLLFAPWHVRPRTHGELHFGDVLEYEVYDLNTGHKRGAFLNLYQGRFLFAFLGWAGADQGESPEPRTRQ
jgi:hypothetical protein